MFNEKYESGEWNKLWNELDKIKKAPSFAKQEGKEYNFKESGLKTGDFGIGAAMMANYQDPIKGLQADIRKGMGHIEFSPSLNGQGMKSFSKISKEKRRALREIKKVNNATIGTHADANVMGLTGFDSQRFSFNEERRHQSVAKIKEAIDFAADVSEGGAITFHAGDFVRPVAGTTWGNGSKFGQGKDDKVEMVLGVIDSANNELVRESLVKIDDKLTVPHLSGKETEVDFGGFKGKLPELKTTGEGKKKEIAIEHLENFKHYAAWLYDQNDDFKKKVKNDIIKKRGLKEKDFIKTISESKDGKIPEHNEIKDYAILELAAKYKFKQDQKFGVFNQVNRAMGQVGRQRFEVETLIKNMDHAKKMSKEKNDVVYVSRDLMRAGKPVTDSHLRAQMSSKDHQVKEEDFEEQVEDMIRIENGEVVGVGKYEKCESEEEITVNGWQSGDFKLSERKNVERQFEMLRKNQLNQLHDQYQKIKDDVYKTVSEVSKKQNEKSFAELGVLLNEKNKVLKKQGKKELYFAVENLFPEMYGSSPEELLDIINTAKGAMAKELMDDNGYSKSKAITVADKSIKATFDMGHLHMWKKYFKRNKQETDDKFDERFNKWALKETKKLIDKRVIGNVHIADNFGHEDDHLTIGQGTVPIHEYMKLFDKARAEGKITGKFSVEGFDESGERQGVHEAWKQSGVQIFRSQTATDKWVNLEDDSGHGYGFDSTSDSSYLNSGNKPYFVFGKYTPSHDPNDWAPWDEMGME